MAILKIARMGHPVLAETARPVAEPGAPEIRRLVSDMIETMIDANGAGLAAPQVHVPLRVVVFQAPEGRSDPGLSEAERFDHTAPLTVLINPEIEVVGAEQLHQRRIATQLGNLLLEGTEDDRRRVGRPIMQPVGDLGDVTVYPDIAGNRWFLHIHDVRRGCRSAITPPRGFVVPRLSPAEHNS